MTGLAIGIDIGGTKTHLRTYGLANSPRDLVVPSAEWRTRDWDQDARRLAAFAENMAAGIRIGAVAVGAHGCDDADECAAFEAAFARCVSYPVKVMNDAELLPAVRDLPYGIGVVAGTGSIAVARHPDGRMLVAGGWGWVIGDEGSAPGLVREAARLASHHLDLGGSASDPLVLHLCAALGIASPTRLGSAIGDAGGAAELGRHAHAVFDAAKDGSRLARKVIDDGGRALVELVARLRQVGSVANHVVAGGGVIVAQPELAQAFLDRMAERFQGDVTAEIYAGPPVEGACRVADRMTSVRLAQPPSPAAVPN